MIKMWRTIIITLFLIISMSAFGKTEAQAAILMTSFKDQMLVGTKQYEVGTLYWVVDEVQHRANITESTTVHSSDESIIKTWIEDKSGIQFLYLEAVKPGTATITIYSDGKTYVFDVTSLSFEEGSFSMCKENVTIDKGDVHQFGIAYSISWGNTIRSIREEHLVVTSSNEKVVAVEYKYMSGGYLSSIDMKAVGAGTATITVEMQTDEEGYTDLNGLKDTFQITVTEGPKASKPKLYSEIGLSKATIYHQVMSDKIMVGFDLLDEYTEYEIHVSTSKKKGFKKSGWAKADNVKIEASDGNDSYEVEPGKMTFVYISKYGKQKLKPNKKYYIKIRARYTDSYHSTKWSDWSAVKEFWTAPAKIKNSKIKFSKSSRKVTFPKVSGTKGYVYITSSVDKQGYNMFGNPVYFSVTESRTTTKRSFKVSTLKYKMKPESVYNVRPYAKHGKYYYIDGSAPVKSLKKFKYWDSDKYAGS